MEERDRSDMQIFINWVKALNLDGVKDIDAQGFFVKLRDGTVFLRLMEIIRPGVVEWSKVNFLASNKFKMLANCNLVTTLMEKFNFSEGLVSARDLVEERPKAVLCLMWLLMREYFKEKHGIKNEEEFKNVADAYLYESAILALPVQPDVLEPEPLQILLYYGDEGEVFMTFHDEDELDCARLADNFTYLVRSPEKTAGRHLAKLSTIVRGDCGRRDHHKVKMSHGVPCVTSPTLDKTSLLTLPRFIPRIELQEKQLITNRSIKQSRRSSIQNPKLELLPAEPLFRSYHITVNNTWTSKSLAIKNKPTSSRAAFDTNEHNDIPSPPLPAVSIPQKPIEPPQPLIAQSFGPGDILLSTPFLESDQKPTIQPQPAKLLQLPIPHEREDDSIESVRKRLDVVPAFKEPSFQPSPQIKVAKKQDCHVKFCNSSDRSRSRNNSQDKFDLYSHRKNVMGVLKDMTSADTNVPPLTTSVNANSELHNLSKERKIGSGRSNGYQKSVEGVSKLAWWCPIDNKENIVGCSLTLPSRPPKVTKFDCITKEALLRNQTEIPFRERQRVEQKKKTAMAALCSDRATTSYLQLVLSQKYRSILSTQFAEMNKKYNFINFRVKNAKPVGYFILKIDTPFNLDGLQRTLKTNKYFCKDIEKPLELIIDVIAESPHSRNDKGNFRNILNGLVSTPMNNTSSNLNITPSKAESFNQGSSILSRKKLDNLALSLKIEKIIGEFTSPHIKNQLKDISSQLDEYLRSDLVLLKELFETMKSGKVTVKERMLLNRIESLLIATLQTEEKSPKESRDVSMVTPDKHKISSKKEKENSFLRIETDKKKNDLIDCPLLEREMIFKDQYKLFARPELADLKDSYRTMLKERMITIHHSEDPNKIKDAALKIFNSRQA